MRFTKVKPYNYESSCKRFWITSARAGGYVLIDQSHPIGTPERTPMPAGLGFQKGASLAECKAFAANLSR